MIEKESKEIYYAHSSDNLEKSWQTLLEHLCNTAEIAKKFASKFNVSDFGYICGLMHDLGKYSQQFQEKLKGKAIKVDHSTAGAQEVIKLYGEKIGKLLAYCIAGHHSGLQDYGTAASSEGTLFSRLNKIIEDYSAYKAEIDMQSIKILPGLPITPVDQKYLGFTIAFFVKMLYSCLVDADFLDTESYMADKMKPRGNNLSISQLNDKFNRYFAQFICEETKINKRRQEILEQCLKMSKNPMGLFTLTVPTGGGKTYSSLAFALNHAQLNNLDRIIYIIPYTSIIEQNAKVFKDVLGDENVLEHHSNYQFDINNSEDIYSIDEKLKLASENWDIPVVVTTNVQFFESLFSNRSSKCRKIHNMAKSVLIFDEVQMLPIQYLKPCLLAISELVKNYRSTAIFCTATQPSINDLLPESVTPVEIMENPRKLYVDFKKVSVIKKDEIDDDTLAEELNNYEQVLCIVNTRKHAKEIFKRLKGEAFHLSTLMCPVHRKEVLEEIRKRLEPKNRKVCRVVSTQLIEAGVDVDFPVVYRSLAGIDSIVQSAGRCNREGKSKEGKVFVFKPISEYAKVRGYLERTGKVAEMIFRKYDDPISLEAIDDYFKYLYDLEGEEALDKKNIIECFEERRSGLEFDFQTAAERFRLIENNTYSIIIPYDEKAMELIEKAKFTSYPRSIARKLQPYTVSIYENEFKDLCQNGAIKVINNSFLVLENPEINYEKFTGLNIPKNTYGEAIFA
ncbi:MAG TPA: CRISPR-associated helicase Cas3' [Bacillota bacterium]|jgi:CRISPR-associated helicase Cas3/CRISPR-associated endonuclease Cas3-HD|nr:CRISPR-associated helicase Cas3' [Bacillota bacterium]HPO97981.1 CRISPR-associated helicase Cas3' [Bacillota bacterium]